MKIEIELLKLIFHGKLNNIVLILSSGIDISLKISLFFMSKGSKEYPRPPFQDVWKNNENLKKS